MAKRLILAVILSWLVLITWSSLTPKPQPTENKEVATQSLQEAAPSPVSPTNTFLASNPAEPSLFTISQPKEDFVFSETAGSLKEAAFKDYQLSKLNLRYAFLLGDGSWTFKKNNISGSQVSFVYADKDKKIVKDFNFGKSNYVAELKIIVQNTSGSPLEIKTPLLLGVVDLKTSQAQQQMITASTDKGMKNLSPNRESQLQGIKYVALKDKYFILIVQSGVKDQQAFIKKINPNLMQVGFVFDSGLIQPGAQVEKTYSIYLGPQDLGLMTKINPDWSGILSYGSLDFIAQFMLKILGFFHAILHNWGLAIILMGILIFICLLPLTSKQMRSMKAMQALQPKMDELRKKYKDNPQKLNQEMVQFWRTNKINPASGCLPLLLQLPIIFILFQVLSRHIALKGASFLWIKDLAEPDRLFSLPFSIPFLGSDFNLLPILVAVEMFLQQKISLSSSSGSNLSQQKMMMVLMPILFGVLFYHMPSGLVLYWFVNSSLMLLYQVKTTTSHA